MPAATRPLRTARAAAYSTNRAIREKPTRAPANPPATISPSFRLPAATISNPANSTTPIAYAAHAIRDASPQSRRSTRTGGTRVSGASGGSAKPSSSTSAAPMPTSAGQSVGGGSATSIRPPSAASSAQWPP
ncbi:LOC553259 protein-like protein [Burkholderia ambifaria MEX-5]|uniref:LOC553259 protein-like protein n=1 Tax=Burkholderia ambifaria MEX-5 TaxID=396597 RepID=B1TH33_9BURK|nr:LOC553259 protein-like protein [Burkholderia ambifaria MEX-5]